MMSSWQLLNGVALLVTVAVVPCTAATAQQPAGSNVEILVQGGKLPSVNGIDFDKAGNLWAGSVFVGGMYRIDTRTGDILERRTYEQGYRTPDDLYNAKDGSQYWVNIVEGQVMRRWPDGTIKPISQSAPGPDGITMTRDETKLYVADCFLNRNLYEVDIEGKQPMKVVTDQLDQLCASDGMRFGPDGKLYGTRWFAGTVVRIDVDSGAFEDVVIGFGAPASLKFDRNDNLYVADARGGVYKADPKTGNKEVAVMLPAALDNLTFSPDNRMFVSSSTFGKIWEVIAGQPPRVVLDGGLSLASGVTLRPRSDGVLSLFVADMMGLWEFDARTGATIGHAKDVEMGQPIYANIGTVTDVDTHGEFVLVCSTIKNFVKIWDPRAQHTKHVFKSFAAPTAVASLGGDFAVAELAKGRVLKVTPQIVADQPIADTPFFQETIADGLKAPVALAFADGRLFVADMVAGAVLKIMEGGKIVPAATLVRGLDRPQGIAVADGMVYVIEAGAGKLKRIAIDTGKVETVAEGMAFGNAPDANNPKLRDASIKGVAVAEGYAWITGDRGDDGFVIYRVSIAP
jgi:sugar lactone lactonase YvrE